MITPGDLLSLAQQLCTPAPPNDSAAIRGAMSRAYYAVFHTVMDKFRPRYASRYNDTGQDHEANVNVLLDLASSAPVKDRADYAFIANQVTDLKSWRVKADYRLARNDIIKNKVSQKIRTADAVIKKLASLP